MPNDAARRTLAVVLPYMVVANPPPMLTLNPICGAAAAADNSTLWTTLEFLGKQKTRQQRPRPEIGGKRITEEWLETQTDTQCLWAFKMTANELRSMVIALELPEDGIHISSGCRFTSLEALCLTCARFRTAGDLYELSIKYCRARSAISEIVNWVSMYIDYHWSHLLDFDHDHLLSTDNLRRYADAIHALGAPLQHAWGFIDCTIRRICRPRVWQRQAYSGHKKYHALKFQAVMLPNGMFGHLFGPQEGRRNDNFMLTESSLLERCEEYAMRDDANEDGPLEEQYFQLFGDPAYGVSHILQSPFSGLGERTEEEKLWNNAMATVRIEVEHGFGIVTNTFPFLNAGWKMHLYSSPVGSYYRSAVLLVNGMNCLRPNQVAQRLECQPPSLFDYFHH